MTSTLTKNSIQTEKLPAGGTNPNQFDVLEAWYPIHYINDLDKSKLTRFTILNKDVVIWWDKKTSAFKVFEDKCPHRLVPLSEGRIAEDGLLECPYHGWAFSGNGNCERIPQQPEGIKAETSQRACVKSFPTSVKQGLLFIFPGNPENAEKIEVPIIEAIEENPDEWVVLNTFRDLPYDALTLLENVIDSSHIPFTHHATVGNRDSVSPVELELVESGKNGFTGIWQDGPRKGTLGKQDTSFIAPGFVCHDLTAKQLGRTLTVVYATPIRKGECRLFARFPFKFASKLPAFFIKLTPRWYSHISNNRILEDDQIFLHYQERFLEESGGSPNFNKAFYLPTKADTYVSELRKWVNDYNANPFPGESLPPRLSTEELLDRYHSHTKHCGSCRKALARIKQLRIAITVLAAVTWAMIPLTSSFQNESIILPLSFSAIFLLLGGVWFGLGRLEHRMYRGEEVPPRNLPKN
ncbi:pheophorbide a oxygenase [Calothrix parasitica NIES-267]|uniref:Pheophorbide a oxygenase n=1 Tax=Calothrix parasitica NIES-267 TaxID=1973488 RepID=A0A1Z4LPQ5_9CYAN|nr:pheophorbide a oxygenase [Calothrix parasitica NIES-267]